MQLQPDAGHSSLEEPSECRVCQGPAARLLPHCFKAVRRARLFFAPRQFRLGLMQGVLLAFASDKGTVVLRSVLLGCMKLFNERSFPNNNCITPQPM